MSTSDHDRSGNSLDAIRAQIWEQTTQQTLARIAFLEQACADLSSGLLTGEQRTLAGSEAHKLSGSLGTFGFLEAFRLARAIEQMFKQKDELTPADGNRLTQLLPQLRRELDLAVERLKANLPAR
jgi:HPt (histidine-containing phosphotransfer) domain-containing protein